MSSSSSSSMGSCGSLALAAATAVAFSGSLVIFSLCRAHMAGAAPPASAEPALRPCLSNAAEKRRSGGNKTSGRRKAEKRVRFADDVVDNEGAPRPARSAAAASTNTSSSCCRGAAEERMMPANREALYRGMLRDRSAHRVACSY